MGFDTDWGRLMEERQDVDRRTEVATMLQKQIDALHTNATLVSRQISDLAVRAQRVDEEISNSNKHLRALSQTLDAHMNSEEKRSVQIEKRIGALSSGQDNILTTLTDAAETLRQVRDTRTAWRVLTGAGRGIAAVLAAIATAAAIIIGTIEYVTRRGGP